MIENSLKSVETSENMQALLTALAPLADLLKDESFGDFENKSSLRGSSRSSTRDAC